MATGDGERGDRDAEPDRVVDQDLHDRLREPRRAGRDRVQRHEVEEARQVRRCAGGGRDLERRPSQRGDDPPGPLAMAAASQPVDVALTTSRRRADHRPAGDELDDRVARRSVMQFDAVERRDDDDADGQRRAGRRARRRRGGGRALGREQRRRPRCWCSAQGAAMARTRTSTLTPSHSLVGGEPVSGVEVVAESEPEARRDADDACVADGRRDREQHADDLVVRRPGRGGHLDGGANGHVGADREQGPSRSAPALASRSLADRIGERRAAERSSLRRGGGESVPIGPSDPALVFNAVGPARAGRLHAERLVRRRDVVGQRARERLPSASLT